MAGELLVDAGVGGTHSRVCAFDVTVERQGQQARIHLFPIEGARVTPYPLVVPVRLDLLPDLVPLLAEEVDRDLQVPGFVHLDEAIERNPAQDLRVGVMEAPGASLPDPLIRLAPAPTYRAAQTVEHSARVAVEAPAAVQEPGGAVDDLSVDVELELTLGVVADPHRARPREAFQMHQLPLGHPRLAEHVVEHLELRPGQARCVQQPAEEGLRLLPVAECEQGAQRERGVAQPAVAVVPVPYATKPLGEGGGRRRDKSAGGRVGHQFQCQGAANDRVAVRSLVGATVRPLLPPANRPIDPSAGDLPEKGNHSWSFCAVGEGKILVLSALNLRDPTSATFAVGQLQRQLAAQSEGRSIDLAPQTEHPTSFEHRAEPTIIRARFVEDLYLDFSL